MVPAKLELGQHRENLASLVAAALEPLRTLERLLGRAFLGVLGRHLDRGGFATAGKVGALGYRTRNLWGPIGGGCPGALTRHRQPQTLANGRNDSLRQSLGNLNAAV